MIGKHVVIDTLDNFKAKLDLIPSSAIVLIKDVGQIYAHGTYFGAQKTYSLLTKTADGLAPQGGTSASSLISDVDTEWVLTVTNGENPTWRKLPANAFNSSSYTLSSATTSDLGGIKVGQVYTATFDDLVGQYYKINVDKNGLAYVHVPWVNNPYTASGSGITLKDNVFSLSLNSVTKLDLAIGNKIYAVSLDKNGKLCVSVPWTDTNNIFVGASETINGSSGMVPAPIANQHRYFLRGDGTWVKPNLSDLNDDVINGNYLPLSGGTITGDHGEYTPLIVTNKGLSEVWIQLRDSVGNTYIGSDKGQPSVYIEGDHNYLLVHSGNYYNYALPLSGGRIDGASYIPLQINSTDASVVRSCLYITHNGGSKAQFGWDGHSGWGTFLFNYSSNGVLGITDGGTPYFGIQGGNLNTLIHSGNIGNQSVSYASDADKLDGYHATTFTKSLVDNSEDFLSYTNRARFQTSYIDGQGDFCSLVIPTWTGNNANNWYLTELRFAIGGGLKVRASKNGNVEYGWKTIATTESNVASATRLQTARTIWGQSFDGSDNISGSIDNCNWIRYYKGGSVSGYIVGRGEEITGGDGLGLWTYGNTPIFLGTGALQRMTIDSSGNVGIGTTSPVHKLDVNGSIYGSHYYGNEITLYTRGNGTYTRAWISAKDSSGDFIIEAPLTTESESGTRAPITLTWRGGYPAKGGLKITGYSEAVLGGNKIWHAGNDGSGSGLNADLLDGYHISVGAAGTNSSTIYFVT